jgi:hypothetical protein
MTSLRFGLCVCVVGLLASTGCPADDGEDDGNDDAAVTTTAETGMMEESTGTPNDSTGATGELSHATDIQPIWDVHCVDACHEVGGQWGAFLDLSGDAYAAIVGVPSPQFADLDHIEPGDPDASYIWHKINGTQVMAGGSGAAMPSGGLTTMTQAEIDTIEAWILAGAPM